VADTVGSTVESVDATPSAAPSLPSARPPATPPAPAAPQAPVKLQTEAAPTPSPSPSSSGVDVPSGEGIAGAARNSIGSVTSAGEGTTQQVATSAARSDGRQVFAHSDGSQVSTPPNGPDAGVGKAAPRAVGTPSSAPPSIAPAEMAPLQRWFAYIWPAIPLGGVAGRGWTARVIWDLFRPVAAATARLLFPAPSVARATGDSPLVGHPRTAISPQLSLPNAPASADGKRIIYCIVLAALLALLAFTIWREFRSALRPGMHW
jgi:hypothetical protein